MDFPGDKAAGGGERFTFSGRPPRPDRTGRPVRLRLTLRPGVTTVWLAVVPAGMETDRLPGAAEGPGTFIYGTGTSPAHEPDRARATQAHSFDIEIDVSELLPARRTLDVDVVPMDLDGHPVQAPGLEIIDARLVT
jgi:hypothetical protein